MKDIIKLTLVITIISVIAALIIAFTFVKTKDTIATGQKQAQEEALKLVVPEGFEISEKTGDDSSVPQQYWVAEKGDEVLYIFKIASTGYSSNIVYLVSIDTNGGIQGMTVTEQSETPGLGTRVQEVISKKYIWNGLFSEKEKGNAWFTEQFKGINIYNDITIDKSMGEWHKLDETSKASLRDKNGITAITGATVSTIAVARGLVTKARAYLQAIRG